MKQFSYSRSLLALVLLETMLELILSCRKYCYAIDLLKAITETYSHLQVITRNNL